MNLGKLNHEAICSAKADTVYSRLTVPLACPLAHPTTALPLHVPARVTLVCVVMLLLLYLLVSLLFLPVTDDLAIFLGCSLLLAVYFRAVDSCTHPKWCSRSTVLGAIVGCFSGRWLVKAVAGKDVRVPVPVPGIWHLSLYPMGPTGIAGQIQRARQTSLRHQRWNKLIEWMARSIPTELHPRSIPFLKAKYSYMASKEVYPRPYAYLCWNKKRTLRYPELRMCRVKLKLKFWPQGKRKWSRNFTSKYELACRTWAYLGAFFSCWILGIWPLLRFNCWKTRQQSPALRWGNM